MINRLADQVKSRRCLGVLLVLVIFVALVISFLLFVESNRAADELKKDQSQNVTACAYIVDNTLNDVISDLDYFRTSPDLFRFISSPDQVNYNALAQLFTSFVDNKKYLQLSYINAYGHEMLRVDYRKGQAQVTPHLQNKMHREYFKNTTRLTPGQIYYSPIEPGLEQVEIDIPQQPVMRMATPVYDANATLWGILIINLDAKQLVNQLRQTCTHDRIIIFDQPGKIIYDSTAHADAFALNNSPGMEKLFPGSWQMIQQNDPQFISDQWLWSWHAVDLENADADKRRLFIASLIAEDILNTPYSKDYLAVVSLGTALLGLWVYVMVCLRAKQLKRLPRR